MEAVKEEKSELVKKDDVNFVIGLDLDDTLREANLPYTSEEKEAILLRAQEEDGLSEPLYVWKETHKLLWGYTEYELAEKHGIQYQIVEKSFATMADALAFVAEKKIAIPTITLFEKIMTARPFGEYWTEKYDREHPLCVAAAHKNNGVLDALGIVGVKVGVSRSTVNKVNRILDSKKEDLIEKCRKGELSISAAYDSINGSAEDKDSNNPQNEVKDNAALDAEHKRFARSKNRELKSLAKYSVVGFTVGEKLNKAGQKFFMLRWNDEHPENNIEEQEIQEAIKIFRKENNKKGK